MSLPADPQTTVEDSRAFVVQQARVGAHVLTARGVLVGVVSISTNLLLIAWVTPAEFGLLALVRALCFFVDFATGQSLATALVRRNKSPEREDYANLAGLQLVLLTVSLLVVIAFPRPIMRLAALDVTWSGWVALLLATMVTIAFGTGARVRLERGFEYRRLAFIEVSTVLLQNVGFVVFALLGRFQVGVFVVSCITILYNYGFLFLASPGPAPTIRLGALRRLVRNSGGFTLAAWLAVARGQLTVVVITHLLGLHVAGYWAFATRFGNLLEVGFDGFRRAVLPAAAQLSADPAGLRRLSTNTLTGAALLTLPAAGLLVVTLPMLAMIWPQWQGAIGVAQLYVLCFALAGVVGASLEPVVVALRGPMTALIGPLVAILVGWSALWLLAPNGASAIRWVIAPMYLAPVLVLVLLTDRTVRPEWSPRLAAVVLSLTTGLAGFGLGQLLRFPAPVSATLACLGMLLWLGPLIRRVDIAAIVDALRGQPHTTPNV
jgi:O-antigen/teichoic acid export membrane protein